MQSFGKPVWRFCAKPISLGVCNSHSSQQFSALTMFIRAAVTKYHRLRGLNHRSYLTVLEATSLKWGCQYGQVLVTALFLGLQMAAFTLFSASEGCSDLSSSSFMYPWLSKNTNGQILCLCILKMQNFHTPQESKAEHRAASCSVWGSLPALDPEMWLQFLTWTPFPISFYVSPFSHCL